MTTLAFGLRADYLPDGPSPFLGGLIRLDPDGRELNLADALLEGSGIIVIDALDEPAALALDAVDALKRIEAPETAPATLTRYDAKTVADLRLTLRYRGLATSGVRNELIARLLEHDAALASGDQSAAVFAEGADRGVAGQPDPEPGTDPTSATTDHEGDAS